MSLLLPPSFIRCKHNGCHKRSTRVPVLCCPKVGKPATRDHCLEAIFDIPCCPDHLPEVRDLLNEGIRLMFIAKASMAPDRPQLDFTNLWVEAQSMSTPKYRQMKDRKRKGQQL
jgi:hypothetical protein